MSYFDVSVYKNKYRVEASSPVAASRAARDQWREVHRDKDKNDNYREHEPVETTVVLIGTMQPCA